MNQALIRFLLFTTCLLLIPACSDESAPSSESLAAITENNTIFFVNPSDPGTVTRGLVITGIVQPAISFSAIDFRPSTRELYALEIGSVNRRLYTIDLQTGFALRIGVNALTSTTNPGFDFSPVVDRLRIVDPTDINFRVEVDTLSSTTDTSLSPDSDVVALAYTNNVAGAAVTTLYGIDSVAATLVRIGGPDGTPSPNGGAVTTIGPLGITPATNEVSFDIAPSGTAYASWGTPGGIWRLYTINLSTGAATEVGILGNGGRVLGISVVP